MRRSILAFGVLAIVALVALTGRAVPTRAASPQYLSGEVIVKLERADDLPAVAAGFKLDAQPIEQFGSFPLYRLRITDGADPAQRAAELALDLRVHYAEPNLINQAPEARGIIEWSVGNSSTYSTQWAPTTIGLPQAQTVTRGAGITVAVLDTGVDATHPALAGRLVPGYDFVDMDNDPSEVGVYLVNPAFGHGTHVAGLIALTAPDAKIMPVRALDPNGLGTIWRVTQGIKYAVDHGANVINLSLSTMQRSRLLEDVIDAVTCDNGTVISPGDLPCMVSTGKGVVVVAAAGNSASTNPEYPAGDSNGGKIAVGASTQTDTLATFSNYGSWVDVLAPGVQILSAVPGGQYGTWSGTSMATPLVAGEAALVRAISPDLTASKVVQRVVSTSARISGPVSRRIDVSAAVAPSTSTNTTATR